MPITTTKLISLLLLWLPESKFDLILVVVFLQRELIMLWSKLQRRLDPSLTSLLERCLQLGAIAKTVHHLLYLVRVIQAEVSTAATFSGFE